MPNLLSRLSKPEQQQLLDDLNYLNMEELRSFCARHVIPFSIWIEMPDGGRRRTRDNDRKGVLLERIRHFLRTGRVSDATCFPAGVVCFDALPKEFEADGRLYYGQYDKHSEALIGVLKELTDGQFKNGALARILAREFWSRGIAPTFREYARAWLAARENHTQPNPEWAFLSDRSSGKDTADWKELRARKAKAVLKILNQIDPS